MMLPLHTSCPTFSSKTALISFPLFTPSPKPSPQNPKPFKFKIYTSSTPPPDTQSIGKTAFKRLAEKLRSLGYVAERENLQQTQLPQTIENSLGEIFLPFPQQLPNHRVGHTIDSSWSTPLNPVPQPGSGVAISRFHKLNKRAVREKSLGETKVPTLAELKLSVEELKRLRTIGIHMKKRINVGKAGITEGIVNGIHERWRRTEVVKLKFEDLCKLNMQRTHDTLERKTGGLVIWRSGGTIILYRGENYKYPYFLTDINEKNDTYHDESSSESSMNHAVDGGKFSGLDVTDAVNSGSPNHTNRVARPSLVHGVGVPNRVRFQLPGEAQLAEEADHLLEGLGPRFTEWWGYDPLPVDADLLPAIIPGYRKPFRLLPYGIKPKLTDDEMTTLRRLSHPLPCHFAVGRNRRLHGLALSMVKLWEKCEIAKVAIKRGVSNTNSELMAEELKWLTGGTLLSRDSEFIVFYRGKDFLPAAVSTALEERRKHGMWKEKPLKGESSSIQMIPPVDMGIEQVACDDELQEAIQKNRELLAEKRQMKIAKSRIKKIRSQLSVALEKKEEAEKLLADLEEAAEPQNSEVDKEGITEEERYMLKKVGLRMKAYLPLGRRGIFAGTVENMHLHWKYRELVKILASERNLEDVHRAARTLEAESGGILVAVERVKREYAIIVYRGKNYQRPTELRPRTLLNRRQALKRSIEAQRRESLKLHVLKLTKNIDELELQLVKGDSEASASQPNDVAKFETSDSNDREEYSHNEKDVSSKESTCIQELHPCVDASSYSGETIQLHKLMDTTSKYLGPSETEAISSSESKFGGENLDSLQSEVGDRDGGDSTSSTMKSMLQTQDTAMYSVIDNDEAQLSGGDLVESSLELEKERLNPSAHREIAKGSDDEAQLSGGDLVESSLELENERLNPSAHREIAKDSDVRSPSRAAPLSNRDRLLLRKQALMMRKRPVLAIGRNNVVSGVAKTIKRHFQKNPLAIVNVKGRAEGTSIQEVTYMLEQATGAVLVSQETNKVILYRGWGMEQAQSGGLKKNINRRTSIGRECDSEEVVSPQLMEAIRLECGLQADPED